MLAITRTFMNEPHIQLLDEPPPRLGPIVVECILEQLKTLVGTGVVSVKQDGIPEIMVAEEFYVADSSTDVWKGLHDLRTERLGSGIPLPEGTIDMLNSFAKEIGIEGVKSA